MRYILPAKKNPNLSQGSPVDQNTGGHASATPGERLGKRIGSNTDQPRPRPKFLHKREVQDQERKESREKDNGTLPLRKGEESPQSHHLSRSEHRQAFESTLDAVVGIDTQGRILFLNKGAEDLFQYSTAELLGHSVEILIPVRFRKSLVEQRRRDSANPWGCFTQSGTEYYARRKNATEFLADVISDLLETERGPIILTTIRDLAKEKQMDDQIRQAQKMEALGRLAEGVAHDFNNLLSVMLGYTELALNNPGNRGPIRKSLEEIQKAGAAAASLTRQLLLLGRKDIQDPKIVNLNEVLNEMEGIVSQLLGDDIELVVGMDPHLGTVKADPTQIQQVILNLAANARDAMPHGGKLMIETANMDFDSARNASLSNLPAGRYVKLKVKDTGRGIDEYMRSHIFEPFFTTKKEGTGLGLATVYGIIKQSGGEIVVDSAPKQGTTFAIYLPRLDETNRIHHFPGVETDPVGGSETILVVEDRDSLRELVCKFLKGCGYKVLEARNSIKAFRKIRRYSGPIHLLLTDVVMPVISGPELAARVKARFPETKVLFMSGCSLDTTQRHGLLNGGIKVLKKPFPLAVLAQNVSEALQGHSISGGVGAGSTEA